MDNAYLWGLAHGFLIGLIVMHEAWRWLNRRIAKLEAEEAEHG